MRAANASSDFAHHTRDAKTRNEQDACFVSFKIPTSYVCAKAIWLHSICTLTAERAYWFNFFYFRACHELSHVNNATRGLFNQLVCQKHLWVFVNVYKQTHRSVLLKTTGELTFFGLDFYILTAVGLHFWRFLRSKIHKQIAFKYCLYYTQLTWKCQNINLHLT